MYPSDARAKWRAALLTDPRVVHRWDEQRAVGRLYLSHLPEMLDRDAAESLRPADDAMWDAFFLHGPGEEWREPLPMPAVWGYPIMLTRDTLRREIDALLPSTR